jgi:hypothetical protein
VCNCTDFGDLESVGEAINVPGVKILLVPTFLRILERITGTRGGRDWPPRTLSLHVRSFFKIPRGKSRSRTLARKPQEARSNKRPAAEAGDREVRPR